MLARLILALLLVIGATPVAAMSAGCRDMAAMPAPHVPVDGHAAPADHGCIGCAAVDDWLAERIGSPRAMSPVVAPSRPVALAARADGPPRLPPPIIG